MTNCHRLSPESSSQPSIFIFLDSCACQQSFSSHTLGVVGNIVEVLAKAYSGLSEFQLFANFLM